MIDDAGPRATSGTAVRSVVVSVVVAVASFLLGGLTFVAQGFLPEALSSFANSASGWTLLTVLLVFWARVTPGSSAALGAASFVLLTLGYTAAATVQGLFYDPALFAVVGVIVGPFVGLATSWLRATSMPRAAAGTAALGGIALGDAAFGLSVNAGTTSPVYWTVVGAVGLALLGGMIAARIRGVPAVVLAVGGTAAVTIGFVLAFHVLGSIG